jgi:hypothetical protein
MKMALAGVGYISLSSVIFFVGCGSDSASQSGKSPPSCSSFSACGGDLTGTWNIASGCPSDAVLKTTSDSLEICAAATTSVVILASGTLSFDGKGQETQDVTENVAVTSLVPASCVNPGSDCAATKAQVSAMFTNATDVVCNAVSAGCACTYDLDGPAREELSVVTSGSTFTETNPSNGTMDVYDYCVSNDIFSERDGDGVVVLTR